MECKRCTKKIEDTEKYCDECKKVLRKEKELNKLIDENKKLNELENTIELETITDINEQLKEKVDLKEDTKEIIIDTNLKKNEEEIDEFKDINKSNKTKIIIIISVVLVFIISLVIILCLVLKKEEKEEVVIIDYEKILNEYGDSLTKNLKQYLKDSEELPSWATLNELTDYDKYKIECVTHKLYKDGNIYLDNCKIDKKKIKYSYGEIQEEKGKEIEIFKTKENTYVTENENLAELVGKITCETDECEVVTIFDKYVVVIENNKFYLYNYEINLMEFGPYEQAEGNTFLSYDNKLYGIIYYENGIQNMYSTSTGKKVNNIEGMLLTSTLEFNPHIILKYGYVIFLNNDVYDFVNLNSGNVSYSIEGVLSTLIEDTDNNIAYMTTYNETNKKITIYNSNGKKLFNGKEYNSIRINDNLILADDTKYYIYDSKLKLKLESKEYDKVLGIYDDFIITVSNGYLELVDINDNVLATYELEWNDSYTIDPMLTGKQKVDNEDIIYIVVETSSEVQRYYYIPSTNEFGLS